MIEVYCQNLLHAQELQKRAYDKRVKSRSYVSNEKVWLNSKYIKTKKNKKLEKAFFRPFRILHVVENQAYKLELSTSWRIYDVFYILFQKKDTIKKRQVNNALEKLEKEFEAGKDKEYKVKAIIDNAMYSKEINNQMPGLYYLVL